MDWIIKNWQFLTGVGAIIGYLSVIAWQTKRNSKDIFRLDEEIKENKKESDKVNQKMFDELKEMRKEMSSQMSTGFAAINDKLFGLAKDGRLRKD